MADFCDVLKEIRFVAFVFLTKFDDKRRYPSRRHLNCLLEVFGYLICNLTLLLDRTHENATYNWQHKN